MKFFLDTPNLEQIQEAQSLGIIDGVTTNPSLMAKEGITGKENILNHYIKICELVDGDVSAEVISTEYEGMIEEGEKLAALHPQIVVKVPVTKNGIKAIKYFSTKGIRTNCTLIFAPGQALLAAKAGASYVSPFVGRLDDISHDGLLLVEQIVDAFNYYGFETQVLAASLRSTLHIVRCMEIGTDVVTCPLKPILGLLDHPLTDKGLKQFLDDHNKANTL
ncbi:MAG: fructose-6-phosphate aldolase [Salinivirgaceae bacterium]|jgi:transaldolase|nr:fructose-6-phosphate aldolase [Salinivirgaceae bacterium]